MNIFQDSNKAHNKGSYLTDNLLVFIDKRWLLSIINLEWIKDGTSYNTH